MDVGEDHPRAGQRDGLRHLVPAVRAGDDLVARADAHRLERQVQGAGRAVDDHGMLRPGDRRDLLAQFEGARAGGDPAGVERLKHEFTFAQIGRAHV